MGLPDASGRRVVRAKPLPVIGPTLTAAIGWQLVDGGRIAAIRTSALGLKLRPEVADSLGPPRSRTRAPPAPHAWPAWRQSHACRQTARAMSLMAAEKWVGAWFEARRPSGHFSTRTGSRAGGWNDAHRTGLAPSLVGCHGPALTASRRAQGQRRPGWRTMCVELSLAVPPLPCTHAGDAHAEKSYGKWFRNRPLRELHIP